MGRPLGTGLGDSTLPSPGKVDRLPPRRKGGGRFRPLSEFLGVPDPLPPGQTEKEVSVDRSPTVFTGHVTSRRQDSLLTGVVVVSTTPTHHSYLLPTPPKGHLSFTRQPVLDRPHSPGFESDSLCTRVPQVKPTKVMGYLIC